MDSIFSHVEEYPRECVAYLIAAIKSGTLMEDKATTLKCLLTFLAFIATWIDDATDTVIGNDAMSVADTEECCEFLAVSGYEVPAAGPLTNLLLEQLKAAAMKWLAELLSDPEALADAIKALVENIFKKK